MCVCMSVCVCEYVYYRTFVLQLQSLGKSLTGSAKGHAIYIFIYLMHKKILIYHQNINLLDNNLFDLNRK